MANTRIVVLIDMDCFYVQVEQRENPDLYGKPTAVVQYNQWKKGGIIALSYEARANGVKRFMRGSDAEEVCPSICLVQVPMKRGKADLSKYRLASDEVFHVLSGFDGVVLERASIDEAFLDVTEAVELAEAQPIDHLLTVDDLRNTRMAVDDDRKNIVDYLTYVQNTDCDISDDQRIIRKLLLAARLAENMRKRIFEQTKFRCSAGVAINKMLAKLVCSVNKPNGQTVIFPQQVPKLFDKTSISDIRSLGGKLGRSVVNVLNIETVGQLAAVPLGVLVLHFGQKTANWLKDISQGVDVEAVTPRQIVKSIASAKNFTGKAALSAKSEVKFWIEQLAECLLERLLEDRSSVMA
ncbi:unnamed protein product [Soboliphyme baturini]|uniref:DNA polymerase eta n=1 Tax=Soboliphyme baturini TaxID=241478 RepID=A0A183IVR5_9BILA|nr:unnamed protein product [Soboliphyme baturini]